MTTLNNFVKSIVREVADVSEMQTLQYVAGMFNDYMLPTIEQSLLSSNFGDLEFGKTIYNQHDLSIKSRVSFTHQKFDIEYRIDFIIRVTFRGTDYLTVLYIPQIHRFDLDGNKLQGFRRNIDIFNGVSLSKDEHENRNITRSICNRLIQVILEDETHEQI